MSPLPGTHNALYSRNLTHINRSNYHTFTMNRMFFQQWIHTIKSKLKYSIEIILEIDGIKGVFNLKILSLFTATLATSGMSLGRDCLVIRAMEHV